MQTEKIVNLPTIHSETHGQAQLQSLLETPGINWLHAAWDSGKSIPVIDGNGPVYRAGGIEYGKLTEDIKYPAGPEFMAARLYKLQGHFWQQGMSDALAREVAKDYIRLLDGYSESVWDAVCDRMLLDADRKFFPKVGEMKQALDAELAARKWKLKKLQALLDSAA